jgi:hypothetical protein
MFNPELSIKTILAASAARTTIHRHAANPNDATALARKDRIHHG